MNKTIEGIRTKDLEFDREVVKQNIKIIPRDDNIYVELCDRDNMVGKVCLPDKNRQLTRIGIIRAVGPEVDKWKIGEVVAISYVSGTELYAPAFGFWHDGHRICAQNNVMFKIEDIDG